MIGVATVLAGAAVVLAATGVINYTAASDAEAGAPRMLTTISKGELVDSVAATALVTSRNRHSVSGIGIVTRDGLAAGKVARLGAVLAVVDERPVFLLRGQLPAYRDLRRGSRGADVRQLQASLKRLGRSISDKPGVFGADTAASVRWLYTRKGFPEPTGLPRSEVVVDPKGSVTASTSCGSVGEQVSGTLCEVTSARALQLQMPATGVLPLQSGQRVVVAEADLVGLVGAPQEPVRAAGQQEAGGLAWSVRSLAGDVSGLRAGELLSAEVELSRVDDVLIVDAIAVREDQSGRHTVLTEVGQAVPVVVSTCVTGRCAITGDGLVDGVVVVVPGA